MTLPLYNATGAQWDGFEPGLFIGDWARLGGGYSLTVADFTAYPTY